MLLTPQEIIKSCNNRAAVNRYKLIQNHISVRSVLLLPRQKNKTYISNCNSIVESVRIEKGDISPRAIGGRKCRLCSLATLPVGSVKKQGDQNRRWRWNECILRRCHYQQKLYSYCNALCQYLHKSQEIQRLCSARIIEPMQSQEPLRETFECWKKSYAPWKFAWSDLPWIRTQHCWVNNDIANRKVF